MYNLFKPKKIYCVRWAWVDGIPHQDIIRARDITHAWAKLQRKHPSAVYCYSITEIKSEEFDEKENTK